MYKRDELVGGHVIMLGKGNEEAVSFFTVAFFVSIASWDMDVK